MKNIKQRHLYSECHNRKIKFMKKEKFWEIIETTNQQSQDDHIKYCEILKQELEALPLDEVVEFNNYFKTYHLFAYRKDLWSAAMIIKHFCSVDEFQSFRNWLISNGRKIYRYGIYGPDNLVDIVSEGMKCEFKGLDCVAGEVYQERTGKKIPNWENKNVGRFDPEKKPIDMDLALDDPLVQQLNHPRLWEKFRGVSGLTTAVNNLHLELEKHTDRHQTNVFHIMAYGSFNEAEQLLDGGYYFYGDDNRIVTSLKAMLGDFAEIRCDELDDQISCVRD